MQIRHAGAATAVAKPKGLRVNHPRPLPKPSDLRYGETGQDLPKTSLDRRRKHRAPRPGHSREIPLGSLGRPAVSNFPTAQLDARTRGTPENYSGGMGSSCSAHVKRIAWLADRGFNPPWKSGPGPSFRPGGGVWLLFSTAKPGTFAGSRSPEPTRAHAPPFFARRISPPVWGEMRIGARNPDMPAEGERP